MEDGDQTPAHEVAQNAVGLLTTENRKIWSDLRNKILSSNKNNAECLSVVDTALFIVCLDDCKSSDLSQLCENFLCGTYDLQQGVQVGTCTNRWYDKVSISLTALRLYTEASQSSCKLSWMQTARLESTLSIPV